MLDDKEREVERRDEQNVAKAQQIAMQESTKYLRELAPAEMSAAMLKDMRTARDLFIESAGRALGVVVTIQYANEGKPMVSVDQITNGLRQVSVGLEGIILAIEQEASDSEGQ